MAIDEQVVAYLAAARKRLDKRLDKAAAEIAGMWAAGWADLEAGWVAALMAAIEAGDTTAYRLRRNRAIQNAVGETGAALEEAVAGAETLAVDSVATMVDDGAVLTRRTLRAQLPREFLDDVASPEDRALTAIETRCRGEIVSRFRKLPAEQLAIIKQKLYEGIVAGDNPVIVARSITTRIGASFDGGRWRAENIARTEMMDAYRSGALAARIANRDLTEGWRWMATRSRRTCPACLAMDGQIFPVDEPGPQGHPACRCTAVCVARSWRDLGIEADEPEAAAVETGREWVASQPADIRREILGPQRAKQLASGTLDWDSVAVVRHNPGWRDSIHTAPIGDH